MEEKKEACSLKLKEMHEQLIELNSKDDKSCFILVGSTPSSNENVVSIIGDRKNLITYLCVAMKNSRELEDIVCNAVDVFRDGQKILKFLEHGLADIMKKEDKDKSNDKEE